MNIVFIYLTLLAPFQYFLVKAKSKPMIVRDMSTTSVKALTSSSLPLNTNGVNDDKSEANAKMAKCL